MQNQFTTKNQSVEKMINIIEYMSEIRTPMKLLEISKGVGYPASTVLRLLTTLINKNYVYHNKETLKYSLTLKFCKIGESIKSGINTVEIVHPYLLDISNKSGETSYFAIEQNMMLVYLDAIIGSNSKNRKPQRIGNIASLHSTGIGKLILSGYNDSQLMKLIESKGLEKFTDNTITTCDALKNELKEIKACGYAIDNQECEQGLRCIAVPIKDYSGNVIGGISISGSANRINPEKYEDLLSILTPKALEISSILGYNESAV